VLRSSGDMENGRYGYCQEEDDGSAINGNKETSATDEMKRCSGFVLFVVEGETLGLEELHTFFYDR